MRKSKRFNIVVNVTKAESRKILQAIHELEGQNMAEQITQTTMTFEQIENLLAQLDEKSKSYRQQFEQIRDRAERIERDIAAAQKAGDECLNRYRDCLHNGEKQAADEYLDKVSKHRKLAEKLHAGFPELIKDVEQLMQTIENARKEMLELAETGILLSLKQRLENALGKSAGLLHDFSHVAGETAKLADLIKTSNGFRYSDIGEKNGKQKKQSNRRTQPGPGKTETARFSEQRSPGQ